MKSNKERAKEKKEIVNALPGFINQLLLLSGSGQVMISAFNTIARDYMTLGEEHRDCFKREIIQIHEESVKNGENAITLFYKFGQTQGIKELSRVCNLLFESQAKGTDPWEQLAELSDSLWEGRKQGAMKEIKIAESKMAFPLGMLLLSLIIITAAPAMLSLS